MATSRGLLRSIYVVHVMEFQLRGYTSKGNVCDFTASVSHLPLVIPPSRQARREGIGLKVARVELKYVTRIETRNSFVAERERILGTSASRMEEFTCILRPMKVFFTEFKRRHCWGRTKTMDMTANEGGLFTKV